MRVTDNMRYASSVASMQRSASRLQELSEMASSGRRISKPSDDPVAYASVVAKDGQLAKLGARKTSVERAQGDLTLSESVLASAGDIMSRVRELTVQMADGSYSASERALAAEEVSDLREHLIGLANTKGVRGYLFAGTATQTVPFDVNGNFLANDFTMDVEIADGITVAANTSGASAFTALNGGRDIFQDLADLETALSTNNVAMVQSSIDAVTQGHEQIIQVRAQTGPIVERLHSAASVVDTIHSSLLSARATEADANTTEVFSAFAQAQASYEQSVAVARHVLEMASAVQRM